MTLSAKPILGLETEYALLLTHEAGGGIPAPRDLVQALLAKLAERHVTGHAATPKLGLFLESGGLVHGEAGNLNTGAELLEMCTPECTTPREAVAHQRAAEARVRALLADLREELMPDSAVARASLLKCSIDAEGNTFSTHENYRVRDRLGLWRRAALCAVYAFARVMTLPLRLVRWSVVLLLFGLVGALVLAKLGLAFLKAFWPPAAPWADAAESVDPRAFMPFTVVLSHLERLDRLWLRAPLDDVLAWLILPDFRAHLVPFLATRLVFTAPGRFETRPGALAGRFVLSPKAAVLSAVIGYPRDRDSKPVIDVKHLARGLAHLLAEDKRLSVTFSDTNMSEYALWLKIGTTQLVIEAIEAGIHPEGMQLADPLDAIRRISAEPGGAPALTCRSGKSVSALDVQRAYHLAAERFVEGGGGGAEAPAILKEWGAVLSALESDPGALLDRLDWVAKQTLLEDIVAPVGWDALARHAAALADLDARDARPPPELARAYDVYQQARKLDLKYHDIGEEPGYHALLEARGEMRRVLFGPELAPELAAPRSTRAWFRAAYLRLARQRELSVLVGWEHVYFPGSLETIALPAVDAGVADAHLREPDPVSGMAWLRRGPRFLRDLIRAYDPVQ